MTDPTRLVVRCRRWLIVVVQLAVLGLGSYLAFWLRFDGSIPGRELEAWRRHLPLLLLVRGVAFVPFRLYEGVWRYTGIWDLRSIVGAMALSSAIFYLVVRWGLGVTAYPSSVYVIDALLGVFLMGGIRVLPRVYREVRRPDRDRRVLIVGAGDAGERIVRDMRSDAYGGGEPIGFVDDDPGKVGRRIHGVPVLGTRAALAAIVTSKRPHEVLIAMDGAEPSTLRDIVGALEPFKVPIKTLAHPGGAPEAGVTAVQIRDLDVRDLLARPPVGLDATGVRELLGDRCVLVTGAGGSIGSELCRQIAAFGPRALLLLDRYENGLQATVNDLGAGAGRSRVRPLVGDVTDVLRIDTLLASARPDVVFHAAAHKHVPLMELNPCEAVKNNVLGTRTLAEAAARHGVREFVLVSTDKAVNPTSVMGATKRVAELLVQAMSAVEGTRFVIVRFGNVLASNGSVIPQFLDQIRAGGPVTVTHPEMRRYFMLIPEAVQLVLHAASLGEGGTVYALEMGEPIRIVDMARNLIRLSGFVPDREIRIAFTGVRPGEKLAEELAADDEDTEPTRVDKILRIRPRRRPDPASLGTDVVELERRALGEDPAAVLRQLRRIVPTVMPSSDGGS